MLPHIPTSESWEGLEQLPGAGRALPELHVGYEDVEPYPGRITPQTGAAPSDRENWRVTKEDRQASGFVNDPNDWCDEHDDPRYTRATGLRSRGRP